MVTANITIQVDEAAARTFERRRQRYSAVFLNEKPYAHRNCIAQIVAAKYGVLLK